MFPQPKVLLICADDAKSSVLEGILSDNTNLRIARTMPEFDSCLSGFEFDVVFSYWSSPNYTWKDVLAAVRRHSPDLPVIIFSHTAQERDPAEVQAAGGFWLLTAPYWQRTVMSVLKNAIEARPTPKEKKMGPRSSSQAGRHTGTSATPRRVPR